MTAEEFAVVLAQAERRMCRRLKVKSAEEVAVPLAWILSTLAEVRLAAAQVEAKPHRGRPVKIKHVTAELAVLS